MTFSNAVAIAGFLIGAMVTAHPAGAVTFEDLEAHMDRSQAELAKFRSALADDNPDRRRAAMEFLLKSDDPVLVRLAKEAGLNSPDIQIQKAALRAILNSSPRLRLQIKVEGSSGDAAAAWIVRYVDGSVDSKSGFGYILIGDYNSKDGCWMRRDGHGCHAYLADNILTIAFRNAKVPLTLEENGILLGKVLYENTAPPEKWQSKALIDLME